jgi:hypothetical protein
MDLLKKLAARYRKEFPGLKFRVHRKPLSQNLGLTSLRFKDGVFFIEIDENASDQATWLSHEVAHAISWHLDPPDQPHGPAFWNAWQKTWAIYESFCDEVNS